MVISTAPSGSTPRGRRLPCRCYQLLGPHAYLVLHLPGGLCDIWHRHTAQAHPAAAPGVIFGLGRLVTAGILNCRGGLTGLRGLCEMCVVEFYGEPLG
jgi:hypothetical protein